jgi:hypothetical protein
VISKKCRVDCSIARLLDYTPTRTSQEVSLSSGGALFSGTPSSVKEYCRYAENDAGNYLGQSHINNSGSKLKGYVGRAHRYKEAENDETGISHFAPALFDQRIIVFRSKPAH